MDIYDYAMQMERDGEALYRQAAMASPHAGLARIFGMLADAEVKHREIFEAMKGETEPEIRETAILSDVKNIFARIRGKGGLECLPPSETSLYRMAQDLEKKTEAFYREKANDLKGSPQETVFLKIASEERKHYVILENIIQFVSRPSHWLENAEWYHLDEY